MILGLRRVGLVVAVALAVAWPAGRAGVHVTAAQATQQSSTRQAAPRQPAPKQQQPSEPPEGQQPTFRAGAKLVVVDVTVTGRGERPIDDLAASDFEITEDGQPQSVELVQSVNLDGHTYGDGDSLDIRSQDHARAEAARDDVRVFAIFMDDYHLTRAPNEMVPLRRALEDFLLKMLGPTDLVTVMDPITPLSALNWTRDRNALAMRLHAYEGRYDNFIARSPMEASQEYSRNVRRVRAEVSLSALGSLVAHLSGLREGRKSVLYVSNGLPLQFADGELFREFERMLRDASRGNVVINTLDPRGLTFGGAHGTLFTMATETGGRAIVNANDLEGPLERVVQDASRYYLVGYAPSRAEDDGKYHKIQVRVKQSGARVTARKGYWAARPDDTTIDPGPTLEPEVADALDRLAAREHERVVHVTLAYGPGRDGASRLTASWEPASRDARLAPARLTMSVSTVDGRPLGTVGGTLAPAGGQTAALEIEVPPVPAKLSFTVLAGDGDVIDKWDETVEVPGFAHGGLSVATPTFVQARTVVEFQGLRRGGEAKPIADRAFRSSDQVLVRFDVTRLAEGDVAVQAELLTRRGQHLIELAVKPPVGSVPYQVELPLRSLALGEYVLRVTARQGEASTSETSAFAIVR